MPKTFNSDLAREMGRAGGRAKKVAGRPDLAHDRQNLRGACGPCNFAGGARITNARRAAQRSPRLPRW